MLELNFFRIFLFIVVLSPLVFAAAQCEQNLGSEYIQQIGPYITAAIGLTIVAISLAYMLGALTHDPKFTVFYEDELFHLFVSLVIVISIGGLFYFSCTLVSAFLFQVPSASFSLCYSESYSPQTMAKCFTGEMEKMGQSMLAGLAKASIKEEADSTFTVGLFEPTRGGFITPTKAYKRTYSAQLDLIQNTFIIPALVSITVQKILVTFSLDFVKFIIPIGLFFRFLPPLRSMGNAFIAIALALYIIIPVIYALNGIIADRIYSDGCSSLGTLVTDDVMGDCNSGYNFWNVARLLPYAYFLPNLTLAIAVTLVSALNKAFRVIT